MDVDLGVVTEAADDRVAALQWLARRMERQPDLKTTLREVVHQARLADLGDAVGVLMVRDRSITVAVASDLDVRRADELQLECSQGPAVEAISTRRSFVSGDLRLDPRWRFWGPRAAAVGWLSAMSVGLADGDTFGSLSIYSRQVSSFGPADLAVAEAFAGHAAVALTRVRERRPGSEAAQARRQLSRAQDVVMRQLHVDAEQAFTLLRRQASRAGRKIHDVAADVAAGLPLPEYPSWHSKEDKTCC